MKTKTSTRIKIVVSDSVKVGAWIFVSAGITGLASVLLNDPDLFKWYGVLNFVLYIIKQINDQFRK